MAGERQVRHGLADEDRRLLERLVTALEGREPEKRGFWDRYGTAISVFVSAVTVAGSLWYSQRQLSQSSDQFDRNQRQAQYDDIVDGLSSDSVAVQVNSIRRLVQYVEDADNFEDEPTPAATSGSSDDDQGESPQHRAAVNAAQTLAAFIEDESAHPGEEGLTDYRDPQPVVVGRAVDQLIDLTGLRSDEDASDPSFRNIAVDLGHGNFHGAPISDFVPQGSFLAVAADFRAASVAGWDLSQVDQPDLRASFFTCANLQTSDLGAADVEAADFTGANLRGADLSEVKHLTLEQLRGALTGPATSLPPEVEDEMQRAGMRELSGWGITEGDDGTFRASPACRHLMDRMTDLLPGSGYSARLPCPGAVDSPWHVRLSAPDRAALARVCTLRTRLERNDGQPGHDPGLVGS